VNNAETVTSVLVVVLVFVWLGVPSLVRAIWM
jgi:hypothetical protein